MGAAKKKKKIKKLNKHFPWKDLETVGAALKKGQIPYVDFYPLKGTKKNDYIIIDPNKKIDLESNRQDTWDNVFKMAKELYDEPIKAMDVLLRGSKMTEKDESTYILCMHIENDWKEKENKDLALKAVNTLSLLYVELHKELKADKDILDSILNNPVKRTN